jgi:DNA repair and recombination protein RAD54B
MFSKILHPAHLDDLIQSSTAESLALISILTKISNSPILLKATMDNAKGKDTETVRRKGVRDALQHLPERTHIADMTLSGKFQMTSVPENLLLVNYVHLRKTHCFV